MNTPSSIPAPFAQAGAVLLVIVGFAMMQGCADRAAAPSEGAAEDIAASGNLVVNGDFEQADPSIPPWLKHVHADSEAFAFSLDASIAHEGRQSLKIERQRPEPYANVVQKFRKRELVGRKYRLSAWLRGEGLTGAAYLHGALFAYGSPIAEMGSADQGLQGTFDWTRVELALDLPERFDQAEFGITTTGDGALWIDQVELVAEGD